MTMTGPREGGFGALNNRIFEICAQDDLICAAPQEAFNITNLPATMEVLAGGAGQPVHALYNTTQFWSTDGQPATVWARNWAAERRQRPASQARLTVARRRRRNRRIALAVGGVLMVAASGWPYCCSRSRARQIQGAAAPTCR